jgi:peptidoglycan/LPS O-acetylase OafA/YrhL
MLGTLRLFLAIAVMNAHLFAPWYPGSYAVFSFYIISGYLMTLVMNKRYHYTAKGRKYFLINRFIRIYPPYYLAMGFSLALIVFVPPGFMNEFHEAIKLPDSLWIALKNIFLIGLDKREPSRLVPLAWALYIEIFYYILIGLFLGKSRKIALTWLLISVIYLLLLVTAGEQSFSKRYSYIPAASLPFSVGACLYHFFPDLDRLLNRAKWDTGFKAAVLLFLLPYFLPLAKDTYRFLSYDLLPFYLNIITTTILVYYLSSIPKPRFSSYKKIDTWLGDLSYPTYLLHWQSGLLMAYLFNLQKNSFSLLVMGGLLTLALAALEAKFVSNNLEKIRSATKKRL